MTPSSPPLRRYVGDTWSFQYTYYQPDGTSPVNLTGCTMQGVLLSGSAPVLVVGTTSNDSADTAASPTTGTNLAIGRFRLVVPAGTVSALRGGAGDQNLYRLQVRLTDATGAVTTLRVEQIQAIAP